MVSIMTEKEVMTLNRGNVIYDKNNLPLIFMSRCRILECGKDKWEMGVSVKPINNFDYKNFYAFTSKYKWGNGTELKIKNLKKCFES